ncbi:MAG TPA: LamG domain-containing protein, partial [Saprospiraceae bacterium]|nr:LamG domain-containing protein [Saprospiraceae bacterium]
SVWENNPDPHQLSCEDIVNINTGTWKHIVAVYDLNSYKLFINGILQSSANGLATCSNPYLAQDLGDLFVGKLYTGKIDDILIYNRALTGQEVLELYTDDACCEE